MIPVISVFIILFVLQDLLRRFPRFSLLAFIGGPIILSVIWWQHQSYEPFVYLKFYSVVFGVYIVELCRLTRLGQNRFFVQIPGIFLVLNILEAVIKDFLKMDLPHTLNGLAGTMVCIGLGYLGGLHIQRQGKYTDLVWSGMTKGWVLAYTLWNWTFVYLNFPPTSGIHMAVLLSPLLVGLIDPARWGQTRAHSLGIYFVVRFLLEPVLPGNFFGAAAWQSSWGAILAACISCSYAGIWLVRRVLQNYQQRKNIAADVA